MTTRYNGKTITVYLLLLLVGLIGFTAMVGLGFLHHTAGDHGGTSHSLNNGHSHGGHVLHQGHQGHHLPLGAKVAAHTKGHAPDLQGRSLTRFFAISPLDVFSLCLGAGATGILAAPLLTGNALAIASVLGAFLFSFGVVKPVMGFLLRFASNPSKGLEGSVAKLGEASTRFDSQGRGLVTVHLDGENVQVLAMLDPAEVTAGITVSKGDQLLITEVDNLRNTCKVTKEMAL